MGEWEHGKRIEKRTQDSIKPQMHNGQKRKGSKNRRILTEKTSNSSSAMDLVTYRSSPR